MSTLRIKVIMWVFGDGTYKIPYKQSEGCQHVMVPKKGEMLKAWVQPSSSHWLAVWPLVSPFASARLQFPICSAEPATHLPGNLHESRWCCHHTNVNLEVKHWHLPGAMVVSQHCFSRVFSMRFMSPRHGHLRHSHRCYYAVIY